MISTPPPHLDPKVQLLGELLAILERGYRAQGEVKVKREIERAIERINAELRQ